MECSRREFLNVAAAGFAVVGVYGLFPGSAHAAEEIVGAYTQAQADMIHVRSMEEEIRQEGANPEEVKARADRRIADLRADLYR
jgi:hypothetical protein